ncbi:hypothetical protein HYALB_00003841 [Hymenoscyphus albidus]|uniref:Zn(2)-C6 fungal-type domain-containing protein n=1 Tax=Hymenoscyphus albidus TaxID=595503 RepID=A0A9N9LWP1_9HELO|nr:hypothetical protein HYALB_00003841 [Hymenoscyphus albidus]
MPPVGRIVGLRRNGQKQACEPCRKGKMGCDHNAPFCGRCVRRRMTDRCLYHPAPMTKIRPPTNLQDSEIQLPSPQQVNPPSQTEASLGLMSLSSPVILQETPIEGNVQNIPQEVNGEIQNHFRGYVAPKVPNDGSWKTSLYPRSARYNGPTSFSAVFSEHKSENIEDILDIDENTRKHPGAWPFGQPLLGRQRPSAPDMRRNDLVKVLSNIPSQDTCQKLLETSVSLSNLVLSPVMIRHCISKLWSTYANFLLVIPRPGDVNQKYNLAIFADHLFENEERPLSPTPEDGIEWLDTFTGTNLRIEVLGLLFCFFGSAYLALQDSDPIFQMSENDDRKIVGRKETAWRMTECADVCRKHCHFSETVNEIVVALVYSIHVLESSCAGNDSYLTRCRHGDMVTTAITAGLHRLPDYSNTKITTASEYKRRLFSNVYYADKSDSSLNGIPPVLSRLYCDVKPCLDLSDEQLFLPQHEFANEISKLDTNGWNTEGEIHSITASRATWQFCVIREEILESALGVNVFIAERNISCDRDLRNRCQRVLDNIPEQLRYCETGKIPKKSTGSNLFSQASVMLDFLQNLFLIERVASARGLSNAPSLISTAMETLELVLMFWMRRDELQPYISYFDWIITFYGIPSAGVLCVELLKGSQSPLQSIQSPPNQHQNGAPSRSDAIQKLTLFIGFLEWIRPTDGNYKLAGRLIKVVRKVLDHVLDPQFSTVSANQDQSNGNMNGNVNGNGSMIDPILSDISEGFGDGAEDMDWLGSIDWTQGSWIAL